MSHHKVNHGIFRKQVPYYRFAIAVPKLFAVDSSCECTGNQPPENKQERIVQPNDGIGFFPEVHAKPPKVISAEYPPLFLRFCRHDFAELFRIDGYPIWLVEDGVQLGVGDAQFFGKRRGKRRFTSTGWANDEDFFHYS